MAPLASRPHHLLPVQPTSRNSSNEDDKSPRPVAGPRGVLVQLVLPSRGDDAHLQDLLDDDDQVDDYTAIEGLASHQDISELVWMEDDSQTEDEVHFDEHRLVLTSSSWPSSGVSTIVDALRPAESSSSSGPTTTGESSPAESSLMASSPAERSGSWMSTSSAEQSTISSTTST